MSSGLSSDSASMNTWSQYGGHGKGPRAKTDQAIESNDGGGGDIEEHVRDSVPLREDEPPVTDVDSFPTTNGGVCRNGLYAWSQSIYEARLCKRCPISDSSRAALTRLCYDSANFDADNMNMKGASGAEHPKAVAILNLPTFLSSSLPTIPGWHWITRFDCRFKCASRCPIGSTPKTSAWTFDDRVSP